MNRFRYLMRQQKGVLSVCNVYRVFLQTSDVAGAAISPHWNELDRIRLLMVQQGHPDVHFYGQELPSIDAFMRDIKEKIDASWYSANPDIEQMRIHQRLKAQAQWMMVDLPNLPKRYIEILRDETIF